MIRCIHGHDPEKPDLLVITIITPVMGIPHAVVTDRVRRLYGRTAKRQGATRYTIKHSGPIDMAPREIETYPETTAPGSLVWSQSTGLAVITTCTVTERAEVMIQPIPEGHAYWVDAYRLRLVPFDISFYFGETDDVQVDTEEGTGEIRINLNDDTVWEGDPEK